PTVDGLPGPTDEQMVQIAIGDRRIDADPVSFAAQPGIGLVSQVVATYTDSDPRATVADFTATVNWGDGTPVTSGVFGRNLTRPGLANLQVTGSHTYVYPGIYMVTVEFTGNKGARATTRGTAVVSSSALTAMGAKLNVLSASPANRIVATFSDTS